MVTSFLKCLAAPTVACWHILHIYFPVTVLIVNSVGMHTVTTTVYECHFELELTFWGYSIILSFFPINMLKLFGILQIPG